MLIENPQGLGRHSSRRRWWMTRTSTKRTSLSRRVARSLEPRLGDIRTWTTAVPPDQPFTELIVGGERTLRVAGSEGVKKPRISSGDLMRASRLLCEIVDREIAAAGRAAAAVQLIQPVNHRLTTLTTPPDRGGCLGQ
jgi:hypothetical protein